MSIYPLARVWDSSRQRGTPLLVLLAMADRADELGVLWAGAAWLASRARVNRRQIVRVVHDLESDGELIVIRSRRANGQTIVNHYIIAAGADEGLLAQAQQRVTELLALRGGVLQDTPGGCPPGHGGGVPQDTGGVSPRTGGRVTYDQGEGDTMSPDPYSYPEEKNGDSDPLPDFSEVWREALDEMEWQMTKSTFQRHLAGTSARRDGETLVAVVRPLSIDWLTTRFAERIQRTVAQVAGQAVELRFEAMS